MYSSNSNSPISYPHDQTASPNNPKELEDIFSSVFSFPSPYFYSDDYAIFLQHFPELMLHQQPPPAALALAAEDDTPPAAKPTPRTTTRRSSKRDRHSKISTAQGLRDRRMRLSLEVARRFFDLQDMLGFDKASKTVEWLLMKSKPAIMDLARGRGLNPPTELSPTPAADNNHTSSTTNASSPPSEECEPMSGIDESCIEKIRPQRGGTKKKTPTRGGAKERRARPLARESREKARARARERTEKMRFDRSMSETINQRVNKLGSAEMSSHQDLDMVSGSMGISNNNWSPPIIFNYQEHQNSEIQCYGKPWEGYNNVNLL